MSINQPPIICLTGPTAAGKSQLAIELATSLPVDIISVDSVMVYRGMNIGTAKPTTQILSRFPHQLIDIREPSDPYSVGDFFRDVQQAIHRSFKQQRIPLLVGGTMLYFNTLRQGLANLPSYRFNASYPSVNSELDQLDSATLYQRLLQCDASTAHRLHPHDRQRIQRALLVYYLSNKTLSHLHQSSQVTVKYPTIWMAVFKNDRAALRETISHRFTAMLDQGFLNEVRELQPVSPLSYDLPAYRAVGYRQAFDYLNATIDYDTFIQRSITATCQLAKRQLTWLKSWTNLAWFSADESDELLKQCLSHIQSYISA